jgi:hypothetical protein
VPGVTTRCSHRFQGSSPVKAAYHGPLGAVWFRAGNLTGQDRAIMPQDQDLHVLRGVSAGEQRQPAQRPDHDQIDEAEEHDRRG